MDVTSPAQALDLILHGPGKAANQDIVLLDYRIPATFSALWLKGLESGKVTIGDQPERDLTDSTKQYLIIGNDPPDGISFRRHFTATSWLAAWKVKFSPTDEVKKKAAKESLARIAVIDPRLAGSATGVGQALQTIFAARDAAGQPLVCGATVLNAPGLEAICQWLKPAEPDTRTLAKDAPHLRELLKSTIWNELISNREQHHALSNVLGPVILSGKPEPEPPELNHVTLLRRLLSACGLVTWEDKNAEDKEAQPSETGKDLQILLLDDQAKQGWEDWLKECLPGAAGTMQVAVDPTALVDAISDALDSVKDPNGTITGYKNKDARFRLELPHLAGAAHPVVLLDLRLFSGKAEAEREFLKAKLLPLVNHFTNKTDLAWPGFLGDAPLFQRAKEAVKNGTLKADTDEHHEILTWLPRVVALADMSLPIILFSSTGRRDLVEPFKPYGNIITSFEKPRLNDLASAGNSPVELREGTKRALIEAVGDAGNLARAASRIRDVTRLKSNSLEATRRAFSKAKHIEVFHDECKCPDSDEFRVATFVVGFADKPSADAVDRAIENHGPRFFGTNALDKITDLRLGARQWNQEIAKPLADALKVGGVIVDQILPFVVVSGEEFSPGAQGGDPFSLVDPSGMDNVNQELLRLLLEIMVCDVLAWIVPAEFQTCHIFGATRMRAIKWGEANKPNSKDIEDELNKRWNIVVNGRVAIESDNHGDWWVKWPSLRPDSFFGILNEIASARANSSKGKEFAGRIVSAYGTTLPNQTSTYAYPGYSYLHSIADIVARLVKVDIATQLASWPCLENNTDLPLKTRGAAGLRSRLVRIVNCHRALDEGDLADGFGYGLGVDHAHDLAGNVVAFRLANEIPSLSGADFLKIIRHVKDSGPPWTHSVRLSAKMGGKKKSSGRAQTGNPNGAPARVASKSGVTDEWQSQLVRWRTLRYESGDAYVAEGAQWHDRTKDGFRVRKSNKKSIFVFADLQQVEASTLPAGFGEPSKTFFKDDGDLLGRDWRPDEASAPVRRMGTETDVADASNEPHEEQDFQRLLEKARKLMEEISGGKSSEPKQEQSVPSATRNEETWWVRNFFGKDKYTEAGVDWHSALGFYLQKDGDRIRVYAKAAEVVDRSLLRYFAKLPKPPLNDQGNLPGEPWTPNAG